MAQCNEALGSVDAARKHYDAALAASPQNSGVVRAVAEFHLRRRENSKAQEQLRKLIDPKFSTTNQQRQWARRQLAGLLSNNSRRLTPEVLELLDQNLAEGNNSLDQLQKARVLANGRLNSHHLSAVKILQPLSDAGELSPQDEMLLCVLYDSLGRDIAADQRWNALIGSHADRPRIVAAYARRLISQGRPGKAAPWLSRLEALAPDSFDVIDLALRIDLSARKLDEGITRLRKWVASDDDAIRARRLAQAAPSLSRLLSQSSSKSTSDEVRQQLAAETERLFREWMVGHPPAALKFAEFLGADERVDEALAVLEQVQSPRNAIRERVRKSINSAAVLATALSILRRVEPTELQFESVQRLAESALRQNPNAPAMWMQLAALRDLQGRFDESAEYYRRVLETDENHLLALNNLAWLLAVDKGDQAAAQRMIQRALDVGGRQPWLLDTQAAVLMAGDQHEQARKILEEAISEQRIPVRNFYLAQAYHGAGNTAAAKTRLQSAQQLGLREINLHPLERPRYRKLTQAVGLEPNL